MPETKITKCPFCREGDVKTLYVPRRPEMKSTRAAGRTKRYSIMKEEKYEVLTKCPKCGKGKKDIEKRLKEGKKPSKEQIVARMRAAGLDPTKF